MSNIKKILIVVDVQNCFIAKGSLGGNTNDSIKESIQQVRNIDTLIEQNELIVLSRDFHPIGHSSFNIYGQHCRNNSRRCTENGIKDLENDDKSKETIDSLITKYNTSEYNLSESDKRFLTNIQPKFRNIQIKGSDLSYLFFGLRYNDAFKLLSLDSDNNFTIGIKNDDSFLGSPDITNIILPIKSVKLHDKDFIQLNKGEFCNEDSYSAFNYHNTIVKRTKLSLQKEINYHKDSIINRNSIQLEDFKIDGPKFTVENIDVYKKYSTGLWEYIISILNENINELQITVCGLVGNICVIHTILQGLNLWNRFYKDDNNKVTIKFIYDISATLFLVMEHDKTFKSSYVYEDFDDKLIEKFYKFFDSILPDNHTTLFFDVNYQGKFIFKYTTDKTDSVHIKFNKVMIRSNINSTNFYKYNKYKQKYLNISDKY